MPYYGMGYERTIAFPSKSTAYHGGDPGWIRHANGPLMTSAAYGKPSLGALGIAEEVGTVATIATTLAQLGATFAALRQQKMDNKEAKNTANAEREKADKDAAQAIADAAAATQQAAAVRAQQSAPNEIEKLAGNKKVLIGGAVGVVVLIGLVMYLRR